MSLAGMDHNSGKLQMPLWSGLQILSYAADAPREERSGVDDPIGARLQEVTHLIYAQSFGAANRFSNLGDSSKAAAPPQEHMYVPSEPDGVNQE